MSLPPLSVSIAVETDTLRPCSSGHTGPQGTATPTPQAPSLYLLLPGGHAQEIPQERLPVGQEPGRTEGIRNYICGTCRRPPKVLIRGTLPRSLASAGSEAVTPTHFLSNSAAVVSVKAGARTPPTALSSSVLNRVHFLQERRWYPKICVFFYKKNANCDVC